MAADLAGTEVFYWNLPVSRGQNVRLLLADAGVSFNEKFMPNKDFPAVKKQLSEAGVNAGTVPTVTLKDGRVIGQHRAFLRYAAKKLGGTYYPSDPDKALLVDEALDFVDDWRKAFGVPPRTVYEKDHRAAFCKAFEKMLSKHGGPFLLGNDITIGDLCIFQMLYDGAHGGDEKSYPNLARLHKAVLARPGVAKLLQQQADAKKKPKM